MKIAILSPWTIKPTSVGGTERFVMDLAESFVKDNNEVDVYMLSGSDYESNKVNYYSINLFGNNEPIDEYILKSEFNNFNSEDSFIKLGDKINSKIDFTKYDLVQINSQLFLKVAENNERIFTIHTNPFEYQLDWGEESFKIMLDITRKENEKEKTHFVTPSKYYQNIYADLTKSNIEFIPHAIDINRLKSDKDKETIKEDFGVEQDKNIILLPSRLEPIQKQPMLFLKAFATMDKDIKSKYKVICTGADKQYQQFMSDILEFSKENDIDIMIKRFDTMGDGYKATDIVVLPSRSESFGYSALEALSLGIVTILNSIPTYMEIREGAKNCYTFDNDVETLSNVLKEVLTKDLSRVEQDQSWQERYSTSLFSKRYLSLVK